MKTKLTLAILAVVTVIGVILLSVPSAPKPGIIFTGFKELEGRQLAVFCMTNPSTSTFSFTGYSTNHPVYLTAWRSNMVWLAEHPVWCGTGLQTLALPPHASCEFEVFLPEEAKNTFTLGICFEPGTPKEVDRRYNNRIARAVRWLRNVVAWHVSETPKDDYTWSNEVCL